MPGGEQRVLPRGIQLQSRPGEHSPLCSAGLSRRHTPSHARGRSVWSRREYLSPRGLPDGYRAHRGHAKRHQCSRSPRSDHPPAAQLRFPGGIRLPQQRESNRSCSVCAIARVPRMDVAQRRDPLIPKPATLPVDAFYPSEARLASGCAPTSIARERGGLHLQGARCTTARGPGCLRLPERQLLDRPALPAGRRMKRGPHVGWR